MKIQLIMLLFILFNAGINYAHNDTLEIKQQEEELLQEISFSSGSKKNIGKVADNFSITRIDQQFFRKNPSSNLTDVIGMVTGLQSQQNCNVCNTNEIRINGMAGPYTLILIDDMPIVSALGSVYGLNSIPVSLIERIEVTKGPGSARYPSEAMGGIINIKTKSNKNIPKAFADMSVTSWGAFNIDASTRLAYNKNLQHLLSVNYFNFSNTIDNNKDGFTDLSLQERISIYNKWSLKRKGKTAANLALRYLYEDRWGGQMQYTKADRGKETYYGESIYTNRAELIGNYYLPTKENIVLNTSYNIHHQDSYYGTTAYKALQQTSFSQLIWDKTWNNNFKTAVGAALRFNNYDDNTPVTQNNDGTNAPSTMWLPGGFAEGILNLHHNHSITAGLRWDYNSVHGWIPSPRLAYNWHTHKNQNIKLNLGRGYRIVNLFSEEHAALTGSRSVEILDEILPEESWNALLNYHLKSKLSWAYLELDIDVFYNYFTNKIIADYDSHPDKIIYKNLDEYAVSRGTNINLDMTFNAPLTINMGASYRQVYSVEKNNNTTTEKIIPVHTPNWMGNLTASYLAKNDWNLDLTYQWTGPMRLPILPNDYRPEYSPLFHIISLQVSKKWNNWQIYGGVKNLLNFVPKNPIMRSFDPFDKHIHDINTNPNQYTFDASYTYASMQGRHYFLGLRWTLL